MYDNLQIFIQSGIPFGIMDYNVYLATFDSFTRKATGFVRPLIIDAVEHSSGLSGEPAFRLSEATCQNLFDQLWRDGFRPKDGTGNSGHVEALKYHLEDMRKLAFK